MFNEELNKIITTIPRSLHITLGGKLLHQRKHVTFSAEPPTVHFYEEPPAAPFYDQNPSDDEARTIERVLLRSF